MAMTRNAKIGALIVLAIIIISAVAWKKDKLNSYLPEKLRHKEDFIGLNRNSLYVMAPGGKPGIAGMDLNTSDWV